MTARADLRGLARSIANGAALGALTIDAVLRHRLGERLRPATGEANRAAVAVQGWARRVARLHGFEIRVSGRPPSPGDGVLLVANHVSYLDIVAVASQTAAAFLGMTEIASWPLLGWGARAAGMVMVDRNSRLSGAGALRRIRRLLDHGVNVATFPEGQTSPGDRVRCLAPALFGLATAAQRPVVPIAIHYADPRLVWTGDAPFLPHYIEVARLARTTVDIAFLPPLDGNFAKGSSAGRLLAEAARAKIAAHLGVPTRDE